MFPILSFFLSLIGLSISTYTDLKSRIIPDWIPYGMVVLGLGLSAYASFVAQSITPFLWSAGVTIATFILAYIFWRLGAWAGGDVKLFTGLAALNPFNPFFIGGFFSFSLVWGGKELLAVGVLPFFMLNLFILSIFCIIPYSALLSLHALRKSSLRKEWAHLTWHSVVDAFWLACIVVLLYDLLVLFSLPSWVIVPVLLVSSFFPVVVKKLLAIVFVGLVLANMIPATNAWSVFAVLLVVNVLRSWYGFAHVHVLTYSKKISQLEEGDIVGEWIGLVNGKVVREKPVSFQTIIKALFERDLVLLMKIIHPPGEAWANPQQAAGVYSEQIALLKKAVREGKLEDRISLKASAPFAPAVLLAYILLNVVGDGPLAWGIFS
ncbi:MAG: hypothetical protein FJY86_01715 [Candidatus Diapherotrites archaeon]|uniref:Prepilin peptidase n=1 Tax=Candidatus Iainarchaeum sp. TaxID=3101447 RepID=A0A8T4C6L3_9ARCH|nr:hypothetical protein [Candidatus Diapherotrites archaeon]